MPSCPPTISSYSPVLSLNQAIFVPSGDQMGVRSATPDELVRSRQVPLSVGTVMTSPRASNRARTPVGESCGAMRSLETSAAWGMAQGKSPVTLMSSLRSRPVAGSYRWTSPACS